MSIHDVRTHAPAELDSRAAVARLAHDFQVLLGADDGGEAGAHQGLVVGDEHPHGAVRRFAHAGAGMWA